MYSPRYEENFQQSRSQPIGGAAERSFRKSARMTCAEAESALIADALWQSFPEATSENAVSRLASSYFREVIGSSVAPRTVRYWIRGDTRPDYAHTIALIKLAGVDHFFP